MSHQPDDFKPSHSRPSTPPLFNIASPDFKNFESWVRSSPFGKDSDHAKDNIQLSDMDFEAAYAMFTAQTPPQVPGTPPQIPSTNSPITSYTQEINQQLQELQGQNAGISKVMKSPVIAQFLQNSPHLSPADLDSFSIFQNYDELLSANESNAIEQFLDSIMDEKSSNTTKPAKQLHQSQPVEPLYPINALQPDPMPHDVSEGPQQQLQQHVQIFPKVKEEPPHHQPISSRTDKRYSIDTPPSTDSSISITLNNTQNINIPRDSISFPKELNISNEIPSVPDTRSSSVSSTSETSRQYKKRKLLTEDEKKYNHTSSEQRRRGIIKDAFDNLVNLLPDIKGKKKPPKSVVLENAANEIERLIGINNELRKLLDG